MIRYCKATGVGLIPWSPMHSGKLARPAGDTSTVRSKHKVPFLPDLSPTETEIIKRVEKVAKDKGWTMANVALTWLKGKGAIPIVGVTAIEKVADFGALKGKELTEEEVKFLEEPYVPREIIGHW